VLLHAALFLFPNAQNISDFKTFLLPPDLIERIYWCMGTVESWPEPLIDHLRQGLGQPWEHRWRQFSCVTGRSGAWLHLSLTPFKGWLPLGEDLFLEIPPFWSFSLWAQIFRYRWAFLLCLFLCYLTTILFPTLLTVQWNFILLVFLYWQHDCKVVARVNSLSISFEPEEMLSICEFRELQNFRVQIFSSSRTSSKTKGMITSSLKTYYS